MKYMKYRCIRNVSVPPLYLILLFDSNKELDIIHMAFNSGPQTDSLYCNAGGECSYRSNIT